MREEQRSAVLNRLPAASRIVGPVVFVCPVGASAEVFELSGAAACVWNSLSTPRTLTDVADGLGVDVDDPVLTQAIELLSASDLVDRADDDPAGGPRAGDPGAAT